MRIKVIYDKNNYYYIKHITKVEMEAHFRLIDDFYFDKDEVIANVFVNKKRIKLKPSPNFREWYYKASKGRELKLLRVESCRMSVPFLLGTKEITTGDKVLILNFDEEE